MSQSFFQLYILGGGWAMFLLIPASIVAVATTLRGAALLFDAEAHKHPGALASAGAGVLQPLATIYVLAPVVGAVAAAWRIASAQFSHMPASMPPSHSAALTSGENTTVYAAFIPLAWGMTVSLIAIVGYALLRARLLRLELMAADAGADEAAHATAPPAPAHTRGRWPSAWPAFIALLVAIALCLVAMFHVKPGSGRPLANITLAPENVGGLSTVQPAAGTTTFKISKTSYLLNGKPVAESDLLFRLSALASKSPVIILEIGDDDLLASRVTDALMIVNQAGFTQIGIQ